MTIGAWKRDCTGIPWIQTSIAASLGSAESCIRRRARTWKKKWRGLKTHAGRSRCTDYWLRPFRRHGRQGAHRKRYLLRDAERGSAGGHTEGYRAAPGLHPSVSRIQATGAAAARVPGKRIQREYMGGRKGGSLYVCAGESLQLGAGTPVRRPLTLLVAAILSTQRL